MALPEGYSDRANQLALMDGADLMETIASLEQRVAALEAKASPTPEASPTPQS